MDNTERNRLSAIVLMSAIAGTTLAVGCLTWFIHEIGQPQTASTPVTVTPPVEPKIAALPAAEPTEPQVVLGGEELQPEARMLKYPTLADGAERELGASELTFTATSLALDTSNSLSEASLERWVIDEHMFSLTAPTENVAFEMPSLKESDFAAPLEKPLWIDASVLLQAQTTPERETPTPFAVPGVRIGRHLTFTGRHDAFNRETPTVGSAVTTGDSEGIADLYDVSLNWRAFSLGTATFSLIGGVRAASIWSPTLESDRLMTPTPVMGTGVSVKSGTWSLLRASAVSHMPGSANQYLDFRVENIWRVGDDSVLSMGYQHLRNAIDQDPLAAQISRDAVVVEFRVGF